MSAPKFTPGPWSITAGRIATNEISATSPRGKSKVIARCSASWSGQEIASANAALIAAAPDLHEALQGCLNFLENTESELGIKLPSADAARAALAKARGES